jgi:Zn-dependent protease
LSGPERYFTVLVLSLPGLGVGLAGHQLGHALVARLCGDRWATGRLSIRPRQALEPIALCLYALRGVCWAPVLELTPFSLPTRIRRVLVAAGGAAANLLLVGACTLVLRALSPSPTSVLAEIVGDAWLVNLMLVVVNLLPLPGLDGFLILRNLVRRPAGWMVWTEHNAGTLYALLIAAVVLLPFITGDRVDPVRTLRAVAAVPLYGAVIGATMPSVVDLPWINVLFA